MHYPVISLYAPHFRVKQQYFKRLVNSKRFFLCLLILRSAYRWAFLRLRFSRDAMTELTNQQAYDYYQELKTKFAKDYWYRFLKARADRGIDGAQAYVDKMDRYR